MRQTTSQLNDEHTTANFARTEHGPDDECSRDNEVPACAECTFFKEIRLDDFTTDECFQGRRRHHVEAEAEPGNIGPEVYGRATG